MSRPAPVPPEPPSRQQRKSERAEPLPPGVWIVECAKTYQALRVIGPGTIDLLSDVHLPPRASRISEVRRGWWRRSRLVLTDDAATATVVRTIPAGSRGMADVGAPVNSWGSVLASGGDDPLSFIIFVLALIAIVVASPWLLRRKIRANRVARELRSAIDSG